VTTNVLPALFAERAVGAAEMYAVGIRALHIMLDPASGFQTAAAATPYNRRTVQFSEVVRPSFVLLIGSNTSLTVWVHS
jgi:hypothetical protein